MNILLLQPDIVWQSPEANYARIGEMVRDGRDADLIVLPEMFPTGFVTEPGDIAEPARGRSLEWMLKTARDTGAAVVGSVAVEVGGRFYNRCYFVRPDGSFVNYDKRHLFGFGGEDKCYTKGCDRVVVEWAGFRILLQVCYDLRFPVFARNRGDYDMILYAANWPQPRREAWNVLLRARAVENVCYVAGVNRVGNDPDCAYDGGTAFVDFKGNVIGSVADGAEGVLRVTADMDALREFRGKFPALEDADDFELKI